MRRLPRDTAFFLSTPDVSWDPQAHRKTSEHFRNCALTSIPHGALVQFGLLWDVKGMPNGVTIPSDNLDFAWDRPETADSLRERLRKSSRSEWLRLAAWILREARVEEVWLDPLEFSFVEGFREHECNEILRITDAHLDEFLRAWYVAFGGLQP